LPSASGSSIGDAQPRSLGERLRQVTWTRVAFMVALIAVALLLSRLSGRGEQQVSQERAVEIARPQVDFTPEGHNIRLVRRGIPPRAFWAVSFWIKDRTGHPTDVTVVLVDASTGQIDQVFDGT
jgi:hypothetical protein